jgi:hypothetical protein
MDAQCGSRNMAQCHGVSLCFYAHLAHAYRGAMPRHIHSPCSNTLVYYGLLAHACRRAMPRHTAWQRGQPRLLPSRQPACLRCLAAPCAALQHLSPKKLDLLSSIFRLSSWLCLQCCSTLWPGAENTFPLVSQRQRLGSPTLVCHLQGALSLS